jgi:hypothetical protein
MKEPSKILGEYDVTIDAAAGGLVRPWQVSASGRSKSWCFTGVVPV